VKDIRKVLIIDDEVQFVKNVSSYLSMHGYTCFTASSGEEGLKQIEKEDPDLVLLDILMPNMDGYSMYKEMLRRKKDINCVIISGKERLQGLFELENVKKFLTKPIDMDQLKKTVDTFFLAGEGVFADKTE
jgi:DNA-binding NtrC family response regulator